MVNQDKHFFSIKYDQMHIYQQTFKYSVWTINIQKTCPPIETHHLPKSRWAAQKADEEVLSGRHAIQRSKGQD